VVDQANYCDPFELGNVCVWTLRVSHYPSRIQVNRSPPLQWYWRAKKKRQIGSGAMHSPTQHLCLALTFTLSLFLWYIVRSLLRFGGSCWLWELHFWVPKLSHAFFWSILASRLPHREFVWISRSRALWLRNQHAHFPTWHLHPILTFKFSKFYGKVISPLFRFKESWSPWNDWNFPSSR
jgi:hypothetical protein